jgi:hypothetical protein
MSMPETGWVIHFRELALVAIGTAIVTTGVCSLYSDAGSQ